MLLKLLINFIYINYKLAVSYLFSVPAEETPEKIPLLGCMGLCKKVGFNLREIKSM